MDKILFISNLYPNSKQKNIAPFNKQQIDCLSLFYDIDVVAPIPWTLRLNLPNKVVSKNIRCFHPTYYYPPRILRSFHGDFYLFSIRNMVEELMEGNKYEVMYASWLYPDCWASQFLAKKYSLPLYIKVHGSDVNRLKFGTRYMTKCLSVLEMAEGIVCVSEDLKSKLITMGASPSRVHVLQNGINTNIFYPRDKPSLRFKCGMSDAKKIILFVGNMKKEKGIFELVDAFKKVYTRHILDDLHLVLIGSGPSLPEVQKIINSWGFLDNVSILGVVPLEEVAKWMSMADVLCLPSYMEGMPNVVKEALSCGTPVIATNVGGIPELAKCDSRVILVNEKCSNELSSALIDVLSGQFQTLKMMNFLTWEENARQLASIFSLDEKKVSDVDFG